MAASGKSEAGRKPALRNQGVGGVLVCPPDLTDEERAEFEEVAARLKASGRESPNYLGLVVLAARVGALIKKLARAIEEDGVVSIAPTGHGGSMVRANPAVAAQLKAINTQRETEKALGLAPTTEESAAKIAKPAAKNRFAKYDKEPAKT